MKMNKRHCYYCDKLKTVRFFTNGNRLCNTCFPKAAYEASQLQMEAYTSWNERANDNNTINKEHPTPEQMLVKMALENLTPKQRQIWDMYAYQQWTQEEIALFLNVKQSSISKILVRIEAKVKKFVKQNKGAYLLLKLEHKIMNEEND